MTADVPYRFHTAIQVRWGDCDAAGHVNNATYLTYLEEARIAYWKSVAGDLSFGNLIIARVEIDYRAQAYTGDVLDVYVAVTELRNSSFWADYRVVRTDGILVATARSAQLFFDYDTQKPRPMSPEFRRIVTEYEPGLG
jgi:acyl-CoA thioester hydrolase